jgi:transcriptional regulator with XRE-family HTH domain
MKITQLGTDDAILSELGTRLAHRRIELQLTQADVAREAGIGKRTLERIEAGESAQLSSLLRVLRVLDLLPALDRAIPEARPGPMEMLENKGRLRQRASKSRNDEAGQPWSWDDET